MSMRYKGSVISATPPVLVTDAGASGAWTLEQQMQAKAAGKWPKNGPFNYIEDVFSTYLYKGNGFIQTIANEINLTGNGGLVWIKNRNEAYEHILVDTNRGMDNALFSNSTSGQNNLGDALTALSTGFSLDSQSALYAQLNDPTYNYASWTFRKQPKFFDVVTYTGTGVAGRTLTHNLGSVPGCVIIKRTNTTGNWTVWHRSLSGTYPSSRLYLQLNLTSEANGGSQTFTEAPTSTTLTFDDGSSGNGAGSTYVAYLFAHDAGGFGLAEDQNVISCGSCTSNGSGFIQPVNLGYEPQWVMLKRTNSLGGWIMLDTLRGMYNDTSAASPILFANAADAEVGTGTQVNPTATGFQDTIWGGWGASNTYIYIAVRRGPMAVPTLGTKVFNAIARSGTGAAVTVTGAGFTPDWLFTKMRSNIGSSLVVDRLRGTPYLQTNNNNAEAPNGAIIDTTTFSTTMDGFRIPGGSSLNNFVPYTYINYLFKRAPSFFDEVCYTGVGTPAFVGRQITHNLKSVPELIILKIRNDANEWYVYSAPLGPTMYMSLNRNFAAGAVTTVWNDTTPTTTNFTIGSSIDTPAATYVAYLFATCAGVSKVGGYTGTGATQAINCGFTAGARFVLIKRTDTNGDWYYWDSVRGIVAGDDPYLLMNSTALEVTNTDYIDTSAAGFEITSTAPAEINAVGGSYIFLAVA